MIYCLRGAGAYAHSTADAFGMIRAFGNVYIHFARLAHFPQEMHLYCADNGRPSIDPVVKFKMVLIQHLYGLPSLRRNQNERSIQVVFEVFDE